MRRIKEEEKEEERAEEKEHQEERKGENLKVEFGGKESEIEEN